MNIQKLSKISKVTQAALLSLSLATFFCACTGANVAGTDEQEFFKDNCSNELGTYKVSDNRATCTLAMTQDYKDPNWINMKDLVISHCME